MYENLSKVFYCGEEAIVFETHLLSLKDERDLIFNFPIILGFENDSKRSYIFFKETKADEIDWTFWESNFGFHESYEEYIKTNIDNKQCRFACRGCGTYFIRLELIKYDNYLFCKECLEEQSPNEIRNDRTS